MIIHLKEQFKKRSSKKSDILKFYPKQEFKVNVVLNGNEKKDDEDQL
jgi:hypothetical protein